MINTHELFKRLGLRKKLLLSYIFMIMFPLLFLAIFSYYYYSSNLYTKLINSSQKNTAQVMKNIDIFLTSISKLSEFPYHNDYLYNILQKKYESYNNSLVERFKDVDTVNSAIYKGIFYLNNLVDSVALFPTNTDAIYWVGIDNYINLDFPPQNEKWFDEIINNKSNPVVIGTHKDKFLTKKGEDVITIGRTIIDAYTEKNLGAIIINIKAQNMINLLSNISLTKNSMFIVIDENRNVIFDTGLDAIKDKAGIIFEINKDTIYLQSDYKEIVLEGKKYYMNNAKSETCSWIVVSLIPKNELLNEIRNMGYVIIVLCLILVFLSISISSDISNSITKPIYALKDTMKKVENGDLKVRAEIYEAEIGELSVSFNKMTEKMGLLIDRIYLEEEEKRNYELASLQSQINPHFLYNTLNNIRWMANIQGSTGIMNVLNSLIELLTFSAKVKANVITIRQELELIGYYINIMSFRFYEKFSVEYDISTSVLDCMTLKFLLQPIVENAIIHGVVNNVSNGIIKISIKKENNKIIYDVTDNGRGMNKETIEKVLSIEGDKSKDKFNKIGLYNVNKRIKLEFGESFGIEIISKLNSYSRVHVEIPAIANDL